MKRVTKKSLDELASIMPVISEMNQRYYVGGNSGNTGDSGGWGGEFGDSGNSGGWSGIPGGSDSPDDWSGSSNSSPLGSAENPYTASDAEQMMELGTWIGGYVDGYGYVAPMVDVTPEGTGIGSGVSYVGWLNWEDMDDSSSMSGNLGSPTNPFTMDEAQNMMNSGNWPGGFVEGYGYIAPQIYVNGETNGGGDGGSETPIYHSKDPYEYIQSEYAQNPSEATYEQRWAAVKDAYRQILLNLGLNLYGIEIKYDSGGYANAWTVNNGYSKEIYVGGHFFELSIEDSISALVHEMMHVEYDKSVNGYIKNESMSIDLNIPADMKKYMVDRYLGGVYNESELKYLLTTRDVKDPNYYRNEANAYMKENELYPNVSEAYKAERNYRIWYFSELAKIADTLY